MQQEFLQALTGTAIGHAVKTSVWMFPTLETVHFIGLAMLIGGIAGLDLRVLGVAKQLPVAPLHRFLPLAIAGFVLNVVSGVLFFLSDPMGYGANPSFRLKMILVVLAGINALVFEFRLAPHLKEWGPGVDAPTQAKVICGLSLFFWAGVIITGRLLPSFAALL